MYEYQDGYRNKQARCQPCYTYIPADLNSVGSAPEGGAAGEGETSYCSTPPETRRQFIRRDLSLVFAPFQNILSCISSLKLLASNSQDVSRQEGYSEHRPPDPVCTPIATLKNVKKLTRAQSAGVRHLAVCPRPGR